MTVFSDIKTGLEEAIALETGQAIRLSDAEYNALSKIASATKMDCWFWLSAKEDSTTTYIVDLENDKVMNVFEGVSQLVDGMIDPIESNFYRLTQDEVDAFRGLLKRLNIAYEE